MPKPEKIEAVAELKKFFETSGSFFVTDYQGLNVSDMTVLRKKLRENKVKYLIAKNTLFKRAANEAGIKEIDEHFLGPTAVAFTSEDPAVAAKILNDSFREKELPRMKVFVLDDRVYKDTEIKRLAELPPRDILLSQVVAAVEAPLSALVASLDGFFRELVGSIDALAEKKKSGN